MTTLLGALAAVVAIGAAVVFVLVAVPLLIPLGVLPPPLALLETIARAGALVFGGGHVVLPLLQGLVGK